MDQRKKYFLIALAILVLLITSVVVTRRMRQASVVEAGQVVSPQMQNPVTNVKSEKQKIKGSLDAPITIVEFSDFECPSCKKGQEPLKDIYEKFPNLVQIHFKQFPLPMHRYSMDAAKSAECAAKQGKFWDYQDLLFKEQEVWSKDPDAKIIFQAFANTFGLDTQKFQQCLSDPTVVQTIEADRQTGESMQVGSTPTFFINGERMVGSKQLEDDGANIIRKKLEALVANKKP